MAIKKDGTGKRWVEMEIVVPGTPEEVWQALATGPGNTAWFTKTTIDGRVGGELRFDFGSNGSSVGEVTTWQPPDRFGYIEREWSPGAPPVATEITIATRAGGRCVVRMVHSLFSSSDDWDDQMEGFEKGWPSFFEVLRIYLAGFAGVTASSFVVMTGAAGDQLDVWKRLLAQLALTGADAGERRTMAEPEPASGVIERIQQLPHERWLVLRLDAPGPGVVLLGTYAVGAQVNVTALVYAYGDDAAERANASKERWQSWLTERFAPQIEKAGSTA
jgi:uncharacterized protein YndB with AHSA1/START domain